VLCFILVRSKKLECFGFSGGSKGDFWRSKRLLLWFWLGMTLARFMRRDLVSNNKGVEKGI